MGRQVKVWAVAFVLVVVGGLFTFVTLLSGRSKGAQRTVMERWAETLGTPEEVFERYPPRETNPEAGELVDATVRFGIDSAPRSEKEMPRPSRAMVRRFRDFKIHIASWFNAQLSKTVGPPDPPPEFVAEFLAEFRQEIDHVQDVLLDDAKPAWLLDLSLLFPSPSPNLLGHVDLNKLLLADSLAALAGGDTERAERALESAWELGELLNDDPVIITQLVRLTMKRTQAAAVRHMPWLDRWVPRLDGVALRKSFERALLYEGWTWPQWDYGPGEGDSIFGRGVNYAIIGPLMRLGSADASERWRRTILKLQDTPSWCRPVLDRFGVSFEIPMPWWNSFGEMLAPNIEQMVTRVAHAQLQFELTRKLLEMAATRAETGAWPVASEPWLQSRACLADRWVYSVEGSVAALRLERFIGASAGGIPTAWQFSLDGRVSRPSTDPVRKNRSTMSSTSGESMMKVWPHGTTSESP